MAAAVDADLVAIKLRRPPSPVCVSAADANDDTFVVFLRRPTLFPLRPADHSISLFLHILCLVLELFGCILCIFDFAVQSYGRGVVAFSLALPAFLYASVVDVMLHTAALLFQQRQVVGKALGTPKSIKTWRRLQATVPFVTLLAGATAVALTAGTAIAWVMWTASVILSVTFISVFATCSAGLLVARRWTHFGILAAVAFVCLFAADTDAHCSVDGAIAGSAAGPAWSLLACVILEMLSAVCDILAPPAPSAVSLVPSPVPTKRALAVRPVQAQLHTVDFPSPTSVSSRLAVSAPPPSVFPVDTAPVDTAPVDTQLSRTAQAPAPSQPTCTLQSTAPQPTTRFPPDDPIVVTAIPNTKSSAASTSINIPASDLGGRPVNLSVCPSCEFCGPCASFSEAALAPPPFRKRIPLILMDLCHFASVIMLFAWGHAATCVPLDLDA
jgi:hypothetical protein